MAFSKCVLMLAIASFISVSDAADSCLLGDALKGQKGTPHNYFKDTSAATMACYLPMKVDANNIVRVTAANQATFYSDSHGCGDCVKVTNPKTGKSISLMIVDRKGDPGLDIARSAYDYLMDKPIGSNQVDPSTLDVQKTPCTGVLKSSDKIKYRWKTNVGHFNAGKNQYPSCQIMIVDHLLPVKAVAFSKDNTNWINLPRGTANNYWQCSQATTGYMEAPVYIKITASTGEEVIDKITAASLSTFPSDQEAKLWDSPSGVQFSTTCKSTATNTETATQAAATTAAQATDATTAAQATDATTEKVEVSATQPTGSAGVVRADGKCGKDADNAICGGDYPCCSKWGWCGKTESHCTCDGCVDYSRK